MRLWGRLVLDFDDEFGVLRLGHLLEILFESRYLLATCEQESLYLLLGRLVDIELALTIAVHRAVNDEYLAILGELKVTLRAFFVLIVLILFILFGLLNIWFI